MVELMKKNQGLSYFSLIHTSQTMKNRMNGRQSKDWILDYFDIRNW